MSEPTETARERAATIAYLRNVGAWQLAGDLERGLHRPEVPDAGGLTARMLEMLEAGREMKHEIPEAIRLLALEMFERHEYEAAARILLGYAGASAMMQFEREPEAWGGQLADAFRASGMTDRKCTTCGRPFLTRTDDTSCPPCHGRVADLVIDEEKPRQ